MNREQKEKRFFCFGLLAAEADAIGVEGVCLLRTADMLRRAYFAPKTAF
ncbi:MAG: hypothetical protein ABFD64_03055 [Armatimonadota bacterium]